MGQNFVFLWYNMAYLSENGAKVCIFYCMKWHSLRKMVQSFVSLWYDIAYCSNIGANVCAFMISYSIL